MRVFVAAIDGCILSNVALERLYVGCDLTQHDLRPDGTIVAPARRSYLDVVRPEFQAFDLHGEHLVCRSKAVDFEGPRAVDIDVRDTAPRVSDHGDDETSTSGSVLGARVRGAVMPDVALGTFVPCPGTVGR